MFVFAALPVLLIVLQSGVNLANLPVVVLVHKLLGFHSYVKAYRVRSGYITPFIVLFIHPGYLPN